MKKDIKPKEVLSEQLSLTKSSLEVLRHYLASIDFSDVKEDEIESENERAEYCRMISGLWPILEKDLKKFMYAQLMFASNNAEEWGQVLFGRGTFNGIALLLDHWKTAHYENLEKAKPKEEFDKNSAISEI